MSFRVKNFVIGRFLDLALRNWWISFGGVEGGTKDNNGMVEHKRMDGDLDKFQRREQLRYLRALFSWPM